MIKWHGIHPATLTSVLIETKCLGRDGQLVLAGTATGFVYKKDGQTFLVTNWHVVTGRNPDDPLRMETNAHDSPVRLEFCMPNRKNRNHFLPGGFELYENGRPVWLEAEDVGGRIDLVLIPIVFQADDYVAAVQDFGHVGGELSIGDDVVVIGFPFGRYQRNPHAIWKSAMVASEPGILLSGRPRYFLDVPGRSGMSGSPVYATSMATRISPKTAEILHDPVRTASEKLSAISPDDLAGGQVKALRLVGVYSGALTGPERDMGLGFCWDASIIDAIIAAKRPGYNPEPPLLPSG
jgi:hypothetical protein